MLRDRYGVGARVAMRTAAGWSQAEAADAWTRRWPDDPKTFKSISTWELWPGPTGHAPSLTVLDRLAQIYGCAVADLVAGWGEHGPDVDRAIGDAGDRRTFAWQIEHLDLTDLTSATQDVARSLPAGRRRSLAEAEHGRSDGSGPGGRRTGGRDRVGPPPRRSGRRLDEYLHLPQHGARP